MDGLHFAEFVKLSVLLGDCFKFLKADYVIPKLLAIMPIIGIPAQNKTDNAPIYVSRR